MNRLLEKLTAWLRRRNEWVALRPFDALRAGRKKMLTVEIKKENGFENCMACYRIAAMKFENWKCSQRQQTPPELGARVDVKA